MGLKCFFHKIKIGFVRRRTPSIPYTSSAKKFGNQGESEFFDLLVDSLPECRIKKNIIIQTDEGNAEIDCLVLYRGKLFAIEVKRWKGCLVEEEGKFIKSNVDQWGEAHMREQKSPFKQLGRAIYLLKKQIPDKVWVTGIVFFMETDSVLTNQENVWFNKIEDLVDYIAQNGRSSGAADSFFNRCIAADYLYSDSWEKSMHCVICDTSLRFDTPVSVLTRKDIESIRLVHHWSYDEVSIKTLKGEQYETKVENMLIEVMDNGEKHLYGMYKLDYIELGK